MNKETMIYLGVVLVILFFGYFNNKLGFILLVLFAFLLYLEIDFLRRRLNRIQAILHKRGIGQHWEFYPDKKERKAFKLNFPSNLEVDEKIRERELEEDKEE